MVTKKEWSEFRNTGLVLIINQILHIFGWAIVFEIDNNEIKKVYPARVSFRGFDNKDTDDAYKKVSKYMLDNVSELSAESNQNAFINKANKSKANNELHIHLMSHHLCFGNKKYHDDLKEFAQKQVINETLLLKLMEYAEEYADKREL